MTVGERTDLLRYATFCLGKSMSLKKVDFLELTGPQKVKVIKEAKAYLKKQVSEEKFCRVFAQVYQYYC
jgi:hypothetical protein